MEPGKTLLKGTSLVLANSKIWSGPLDSRATKSLLKELRTGSHHALGPLLALSSLPESVLMKIHSWAQPGGTAQLDLARASPQPNVHPQ